MNYNKNNNELKILHKSGIKNISNINLGIELLRMIISFFIVIYHIYPRNVKTIISSFIFYFLGFYTSIFFLISFYFSFKMFSSGNITKFKERLIRLFLPYII